MPGQFRGMQLPVARRGYLVNRHLQATQHVEVEAGIAGDLRGGADEIKRKTVPVLLEGAGGDAAIAAVAAAAAQHGDAQRRPPAEL